MPTAANHRHSMHCHFAGSVINGAPEKRVYPVRFNLVILLYLAVANGLAWWAFAHDKRAAIAGRRRISEDRLLAIAFLGGGLGAKLAQLLLRHKIRSEPFRQQLNGIIAVQLLAFGAIWAIYMVQRDAIWLLSAP